MTLKDHWKSIVVLVVAVVVLSSAFMILTQPIQVNGVKLVSLGASTVTLRPSANTSYNFLVMITITNSSSANLIYGSVTSNASDFSIYVMTAQQYLVWCEESDNASPKGGISLSNSSGDIIQNGSIATVTNVAPWSYLYGVTGNDTIHISLKISPETEYAIVLLSNAKVFTFEPRLLFYSQYLQI